MRLEDLIALARARGWRFKAPGYGEDPALDGVHVIGRDGDGWYVGFLERGELGIIARPGSEDEAVRLLHGFLVDRYQPQPPRPAGPSTISSEGRVSSWTLPKRADS